MAGIYIHIPFCRQKCFYCDFYSVATLLKKNAFIDSIKKELIIQQNYLEKESINTIYFGGGTPSLLSKNELNDILNTISNYHSVSKNAEITIETNPDDLTEEYISDLQQIGFNRISIGIQSFDDEDLKMLNRRHNSEQAIKAVETSKKYGFSNISIDMIYGLPGMTIDKWQKNIEKAIKLNIQHISAYHLTYEVKTIFYNKIKSKEITAIDETESIYQFKLLIELLEKASFIHYEISNFAKENYFSKHNSSYWKQIKYLGLGPSAHSYNEISRQWNTSNINKYINSLQENKLDVELEILDDEKKFNETILISLRTMWGIDLQKIKQQFGECCFNKLLNSANPFILKNQIQVINNHLILTKEGKFISDYIICELMEVS